MAFVPPDPMAHMGGTHAGMMMKLMIVESGAKAKTIGKALGDGWLVVATGGHICELATRDHDPKEARKAYWSHRPGELPKPKWYLTDRGEKVVAQLHKAVAEGQIERAYLAADPDREGERIAWHLAEQLSGVDTVRVTFQEVTPEAIREAVAHPRDIDQDLVDAALVRTFVDRLVGFRGSKMARGMVGSKASMGRVQTPTLGFVVERELEREAHVPVRYFEVRAATPEVALQARFHESKDADRWEDENGTFVATRTSDKGVAEGVYSAVLDTGWVRITKLLQRSRNERPKPPFTTDALLQAAGGRWGWTPKSTMAAASELYEAGHITYLRTDSTRLAESAITQIRTVIGETWGDDHLGPGASGKGGTHVQDAHEAIRPTRFDAVQVSDVAESAQKLYRLIRAQALASQMTPSNRASVSVTTQAEGTPVPLVGSVGWYVFLGWRAAFATLDKPNTETPSTLEVGQELSLDPSTDESVNPELRDGETQPPSRYRQHTLVRAMKDAGIGRPSTYASTLEKLIDHRLITDESSSLAPSTTGRALWLEVAPLYQIQDTRAVFSTAYTADMEEALDDVAAGQAPGAATWESFLEPFRDAHTHAQAAKKSGTVSPKQRRQLLGMAEVAGADVAADFDDLSFEDAQERLQALRDSGIEPPPSEAQLAYALRLLEKVSMTVAEASAWAELGPADELTGQSQASALIDALQQHPLASRPSDKQLRWIADMAVKAELSEAEACALVEVGSFAELTGGSKGTAGTLISILRKRTRGKGGKGGKTAKAAKG